jgi:hypothetical protein
MSVWYLDTDDEITDAVARLRAASDERVVFVVPPGSRVATGRINFRLLAREAAARDLELAIASPDGQVRSLATAAGLLAKPSVSEASEALERGEAPPSAEAPPLAPDEVGAGQMAEIVEGAELVAPTGARRFSGRRRRWALVGGVALGLLVAGTTAAVSLLPTARITIRPLVRPVGPITVKVTADPAAETVDTERAVVPVRVIEIPLSVRGTFRASGTEPIQTRASGEVRFSIPEAPFEDDIPPRTRVSTPDGVEFETTEGARLRPSDQGDGSWVALAPVEAVRVGPEGNVPAGSITVVPSLEALGIGVVNPAETTGGSRQEIPVVTQDDYDAAVVDLQNRLTGKLAEQVTAGVAPAGFIAYPESAARGEVTSLPIAEAVVGQPLERFELAADALATVLAVDPTKVSEVARAHLTGQVAEGEALIEGSLRTEPGQGVVEDGRIRFEAVATGQASPRIDRGRVVDLVRGARVSDARSILTDFGEATVTVWPEFWGDLPQDGSRIELIIEASESEEP